MLIRRIFGRVEPILKELRGVSGFSGSRARDRPTGKLGFSGASDRARLAEIIDTLRGCPTGVCNPATPPAVRPPPTSCPATLASGFRLSGATSEATPPPSPDAAPIPA